MSQIPIDNAAYISGVSGFYDIATTTATGTIGSQLLTANLSTGVVATINLPMPRNDLLPLMRLQFTGLTAGVSDYWFPMQGFLMVKNEDIAILTQSKGTTTGRQLIFSLHNQAGANRTFPGCTVNISARLYNYPWAT